MQVNRQQVYQQQTVSETPLELKQGEVYIATIKEKLNDNDAILTIRGKEVRATFSEGVPNLSAGNRVTIQVNGQKDQMVDVKTITTDSTKTATSEEKVLNSIGLTGKESAEVKKAISILLEKGAPVSKEIVADLKRFMETSEGTIDSKLETVRALANKKLEATETQLRAVHEALSGKPLSKVVESIANEIDQLRKNPQGKQSVTSDINRAKLIRQVIEIIQQHEVQNGQTKSSGTNVSKTLNDVLKQFLQEPNLEAALLKLQEDVGSLLESDGTLLNKAKNAIEQASQLQEKGREIAARRHVSAELTSIQQEAENLEQTNDKVQTPIQDSYDLNDSLQSLALQSKDILVTKVTQRLAQATQDFRELKRVITINLDQVQKLLVHKNQANPQVKQMLETAITKLDHAILKSDLMLFTDMKTEKQLMKASTDLAEAKNLIAKGNHAEAGKIVNEVKSLIDKIIYRPSEQKVMHFVAKESMLLEEPTSDQLLRTQLNKATFGSHAGQEPSARQTYESIRSLGLTYDHEVARSLAFQKSDTFSQEQQQNLKSALLKLAQGEGHESSPKLVQQVDQALSNLNGQQLLSKNDQSGSLQSMLLNLPLLLGGKPENVKVFVNSKGKGQQVEWENCNLYFLLETKKLGDVGILLNSTDRNLSITIKNDTPGFKEKIEPLTTGTKEKLQEVGYHVTGIHFSKMNAAEEKQIQTVQHPISTRQGIMKKGMDFTI